MLTLKIIVKSASENVVDPNTLKEKVVKKAKTLSVFEIHSHNGREFDSDFVHQMRTQIEEYTSAVLEEGDAMQSTIEIIPTDK